MPLPFDNPKLAASIPWQDDWVTAVAFAGPSQRLVAGNRLGGLLLWDLGGKLDEKKPPLPLRKLDGHTNAITHIASSPDGKTLITASYDHTVALWDLESAPTGKATVILDAENREKAKKSSKKPELLPDLEIDVIKPTKVLTEHSEWVHAMDLSRDGELLVTGDDAGEIMVRKMPGGEVVKKWKTKGWISSLAVADDKKTLAVAERIPLDGDRFRGLGLWNIETGERIRDLLPAIGKKEMEFASIDLSPDGSLLAVGQGDDETGDSKVHFLDPRQDSPKARESKAAHQYGVRCVRFTADGKHVLSSGRDTVIRVWNPADGALVKEIGTPRGGQFKDWICDLALSNDQKLLAAADMAGLVQVWTLG